MNHDPYMIRQGPIYLTCQLGTKYGSPSLIPELLATKMWLISCAPKTSAVTRAPGRPSFNESRLSKVDLTYCKQIIMFDDKFKKPCFLM